MSGVAFAVTMADAEVRKAFERLGKALGPSQLKEALDEIGASNVTETQQRFESETDPTGKKWQGLAASTLEKRKQSNPRILRDAVHLYDSITHRVRMMQAEVGTNRIYGRLMQLGGVAGRGKAVDVPARPYLGVSAEGQKEILAIIGDHLENATP